METPNTQTICDADFNDWEEKAVALAKLAGELEQALIYARELLGDTANDEVNLRDELEKWDRAFGHLCPNQSISRAEK